MSLITALLYDRFMATAEDACLRDWREALIRDLNGKVLEIGAGTGASVPLYPDSVTHLELAEPDKHMRRRLLAHADLARFREVRVTDEAAERLSADDDTFDWVVASLVCCSVTDLTASLLEIKRVLKPGGGFVFLEHVAAVHDSRRRKWQDRITPLWKRFNGNCHLNRETETAIRAAGFRINLIERESMRKAWPLVRPTIRGVAVKPPAPPGAF